MPRSRLLFLYETLCQIQLKLTYVAILCFAKPRPTGNLTQRPAKPNCLTPLPTTSFGADGSNRTHHTTIAKSNLARFICPLKTVNKFTIFKIQNLTTFSGALGTSKKLNRLKLKLWEQQNYLTFQEM